MARTQPSHDRDDDGRPAHADRRVRAARGAHADGGRRVGAPADARLTRGLWLAALCTYGVGDLATTFLGLATNRGAEAGPIAAAFVGSHGYPGLVLLKLLTFGFFYLVWRLAHTRGKIAVPLAVTVVGVAVTGWNTYVLLG